MSLKSLFFTFNAFQFFFSLLIWVPVYYEIQKRFGLSDPQIFWIQSFYYVIFCLLEIPTGYLADRLGYRLCMMLGCVTLFVANILVPVSPTYLGFFAHFVLIALARSFVSGASSAYLYETLKQRTAVEEYKEAEGRARAYSLIGKIICWALVGPMMMLNIMIPYHLTALCALLGFVFVLRLPPLTDNDKAHTQNRISAKEIFNVLWNTPALVLIMLQGVALFVMARIIQVNLFQPILEKKGFTVVYFGAVMALMTLFEAIGAFRSKWVKRFLSDLNAISILTAILGTSFLILSFESFLGLPPQWVSIGALCLFSYVIGISYPIQRQLMNEAIPEPRLRASLLSVESIIDRAINSVVAAMLGGVLAAGGLLAFLRQSGIFSVVSVFLIALLLTWVKKWGKSGKGGIRHA